MSGDDGRDVRHLVLCYRARQLASTVRDEHAEHPLSHHADPQRRQLPVRARSPNIDPGGRRQPLTCAACALRCCVPRHSDHPRRVLVTIVQNVVTHSSVGGGPGGEMDQLLGPRHRLAGSCTAARRSPRFPCPEPSFRRAPLGASPSEVELHQGVTTVAAASRTSDGSPLGLWPLPGWLESGSRRFPLRSISEGGGSQGC